MYKNNTHLPWKHKTDDSHGYPNTVDVGRIFYSVNNINIDYGSTLTGVSWVHIFREGCTCLWIKFHNLWGKLLFQHGRCFTVPDNERIILNTLSYWPK